MPDEACHIFRYLVDVQWDPEMEGKDAKRDMQGIVNKVCTRLESLFVRTGIVRCESQ
jgi:hypothetical protein